VEQALLQTFARQFPPRRRWYQVRWPRHWLPALALGGTLATAVVALCMLVMQVPAGGDRPRPAQARADEDAPFIALDSAERIAREPAPRMVETEIPRSSLAALGIPLTPENAGDTLRAELLVAADGQALALRLSTLPDSRRIID
jgi:hypothetical protein